MENEKAREIMERISSHAVRCAEEDKTVTFKYAFAFGYLKEVVVELLRDLPEDSERVQHQLLITERN